MLCCKAASVILGKILERQQEMLCREGFFSIDHSNWFRRNVFHSDDNCIVPRT